MKKCNHCDIKIPEGRAIDHYKKYHYEVYQEVVKRSIEKHS